MDFEFLNEEVFLKDPHVHLPRDKSFDKKFPLELNLSENLRTLLSEHVRDSL